MPIYAIIIPFRPKKFVILLNSLDVAQKTLPVLVAVVEQLGGALGESGFLVIPCVAAHINQVLIAHAVLLFTLAFCQDSRVISDVSYKSFCRSLSILS
jgi:hypothetical protein